MPRRVLLMISSMRGGGSEQQTLLLLQHLNRSLFIPHLYLTERAGDLLARVPADVMIHSLDTIDTTAGFYFPGRALRRQVDHLESVLKRESIDVIYDRTFHMTMIAGPAGKSTGVPRVSTIVSPPEHALPLVESRFVALKRRRLAKAYHESRHVIAVSQQAAESATAYYGLAGDPVVVIPNPVDVEAIRQAAANTARPASDRLTLVCVGRMTAEKGHRDLISAMIACESDWPSDAPPITLRLVGDGPLRRELESLWQGRGHRHSIEFLGRQPDPAPLIRSADALVLPSHFEGMPNVVLEAMALATPVIATRAGGTIELEKDEPTILWAEPRSPSSLAQAIMKFVTEREAAKVRVDAATTLIAKYHNVKETTRRIEELLK